MAIAQAEVLWRPEDDYRVKPTLEEGDVYRPDILAVIDAAVDSLSIDLRELNLDIHDHPEIKYEERYVHNAHLYFEACKPLQT
ncbi:hypothetical protein K503DRAFT_65789 [Rhizopogon vinicolor AM-OR11-026]|uniref:Uncharacterized protein n=1 Tax=Rhizopogon vinicolor AM-OR11-026 TaxID=1314800 RepID=A0A1B7NFS1_9AGAM|nr:hypothetical protein K503DRAFT_65789 [Rhizopogon vinicolor AM-OR11-026]